MGLEARGFFSLKGVGRVRKENGWFKGVVSVWKDWVGFGSRVEGVLMEEEGAVDWIDWFIIKGLYIVNRQCL